MRNSEGMMHCHEALSQLWAYIDGELQPELNERVRLHLEMCRRCYPQYDFHRAFVAYLGRVDKGGVPPTLRRRIFERLLAEESGGNAA
jgi:anti-sigma factor (TIGR02949 family)